MLPPVIRPDIFDVPAIFAPVAVITRTLAVPIADILTFPFAAGMFTFEFPFACGPIKLPTSTLAMKLLLPEPTYNAYGLVIVAFVFATGAP
jgi:hypothetical protein